MVLSMTRPTRRDSSSVLLFKKRVPKAVLATSRGKSIVVTLPALDGHPEATVHAKIGEVIKLSLRTREPAIAKARAGAIEEQLQKLWTTLSRGPKKLTHKQIVSIAGGAVYKGFVLNLGDDPGPAGRWQQALETGEALRNHSRVSYEVSCLNIWGDIAEALLASKGIIADADSLSRLCVECMRQYLAAAGRLNRNSGGDYSEDKHLPTIPAWPELIAVTPTTSISGLFEEWCKIVVPSKHISKSTVDSYRHAFSLFTSFLKHDNFAELTDRCVLRFAESRVQAGINPNTVNDGDLCALKSVFGWAHRSKRIPHNPAHGARVEVGKKPRLRERGFTDTEAKLILHAALAYQRKPAESAEVAAAKKWVPWLCAFSGARVGEMAQLRKQDVVRHEDGIWELVITPEAGSVKGKEPRRVPLHPQLLDLGFIDFVTTSPAGSLFQRARKPDGSPIRRGGVKNRLQEFVREIVSDRNVQPNHGWRHRFITLARKHGVSDEKRRMITGHRGKTVDEIHYGDPAGLYEEICKLPRYVID